MDIAALNILGLPVKARVGKEQWQANWCPRLEPGIWNQEVRHEQSMSNLAILYPYFGKENEEVELPNFSVPLKL